MRRATKWAVGAVAATVPAVAAASPAAAAQASDRETRAVTFTARGGATVQCNVVAQHSVDTSSGLLSIQFSAGGGDICRGGLFVRVHYVNDRGEAAQFETTAYSSPFQDIQLHDAGSTAVTVDHEVLYDNCESACVHELQTKTK